MNLQKRAQRLSRIVLMLLQQEKLTGAKITQAHRGARHLSLGLRLVDPTELDKALKLAEAIALSSNSENVISTRQTGLIVYQFQLAQGFWEAYTRADLPGAGAVGLGDRRKPVAFNLDPPHALIAGTTGSGKTETVKSVLMSLMTSHKPDELGLVLIDPNRDYGDLDHAAHLALPIARDNEEISVALAYANRELRDRIAANNRDGKILVIGIDEAESVLNDKTNLGIAQTIAKRGRVFRVHLVISTQEPKEKNLTGFLGQLLNRFIGLTSNARESALFTGHAGLDAHKLTGKGDFLHVAGPDVTRFQVAQVTRQDLGRLERAEIKPVDDISSQDLVILPDVGEPGAGGRPVLTVDPAIAAGYYLANPNAISRSMAAEQFGLSRTAHNLHKVFTLEFAKEIKRLKGMVA